MGDKVADDIVCALVIDYLNINDYKEVAKELLTIKNVTQFDLRGVELIDVIESKKKKPKAVPDLDSTKTADDIACQLVIKYLTRHGYSSIAHLVKKRKKVKEEYDLQGLDLTDLLNRSKSKNDETNKRKICDRIEDVVEPSRKRSKINSETSVPENAQMCQKQDLGYDPEEINQLVPLKNSFKDELESLPNLEMPPQNSELAKVAKYILAENVFVRKSVALTLHVSSSFVANNRIGNLTKNLPFIHCGGLSSVRYGDTSEESLLLKQWKHLIDKVPIFIPQKFLLEIETTSHTWIQRLLGAYLSQKLSTHHRCAVQLFDALINLQKRKGSFVPEEIDMLLEFYEKHDQKPKPADWKRLALEMGRKANTIQDKTRRLIHENRTTQRRFFNLDEDFKILKFVHENSDISSVTSLKSVTRKSLYPLANILQRAGSKISNHWMNSILPNILAHLYGAAHLQWKEEFVKYVINEKIPSIPDVCWQEVLIRWPFLTKYKASTYLGEINSRGKIAPLHEQAVEELCRLKTTTKATTKNAMQHKEDIIDIYDFIVGNKPKLKRGTEIKLSSTTLITDQ